MIVCSFVHNEATFFIDYIYVMYPSFVYNEVFIYIFIYFYTGPILIAVFITEMVILFKHVIIIITIIINENWFQQIPRDYKIFTIIGQVFFNAINVVPWEIRTPRGNKEGKPIGTL